MKLLITLLWFLFVNAVLLAHPVKITTGKVQVTTDSSHISVTINFFIDDFESAMRSIYPQPPFDYQLPSDEMLNTISAYLKKNFVVEADKSIINLTIISISKIEDNVCQISLEGLNSLIRSGSTLKITNTLLFSFYKKQSNMIQLSINGADSQFLQFHLSDAIQIIKL